MPLGMIFWLDNIERNVRGCFFDSVFIKRRMFVCWLGCLFVKGSEAPKLTQVSSRDPRTPGGTASLGPINQPEEVHPARFLANRKIESSCWISIVLWTNSERDNCLEERLGSLSKTGTSSSILFYFFYYLRFFKCD